MIIKGSYFFLLLLLISIIISSYEWHFLAKNKPYYLVGFVFLFFSFYCIYKIRFNESNTFDIFLIILFTCIFTDIGGYVFGKIFKGPKLISYSPNKTISGSGIFFVYKLLDRLLSVIFNFFLFIFLMKLIISFLDP